MTFQASSGFSLEEMFSPNSENIPHYLMQGFSEKFEVDLWEGLHKVMLKTFEKMEEGN